MAHRTEPGEITVEGGHLASVLEGDGTEHGVGNQVARCVRLGAESAQQGQMTRPGAGEQVMRLRANRVHKRERRRSRGGNREDPTIRRESQERPPHQRGDGERLIAGEQRIEPSPHRHVLRMVVAMGRQDDVDVEQEHLSATIL